MPDPVIEPGAGARGARGAEADAGVGLVLAGGGARGAYEAGVCAELFAILGRALGAPPLAAICGTSIGGINACLLASSADDFPAGAARLVDRWRGLELGAIVHPDLRRMWGLFRVLLGRSPRRLPPALRRGGVLDTRGLWQLLSASIAFDRLAAHVRARRIRAVAVSASRLPGLRPTVFVAGGPVRPGPVPYDLQRVHLRPRHALASAAIPLLFPVVRVAGGLFCDGSIRFNVPLSPAIHLGCRSLVIVNPRRAEAAPTTTDPRAALSLYPGPLFFLGRMLGAFVLERVDEDLERLEQMNQLLEVGTARYGAGFAGALNEGLAARGAAPVGAVASLELGRPHDFGALALEFLRAERRKRRFGAPLRLLARLAEHEDGAAADLVSYLLFDGRFASELVALGRADAAARRDELIAFFAARAPRAR